MNVSVHGTDLYVETLGTGGTPMLMMHGGLGWDHRYFRPWLDPLVEDLELIYFDHRGNGRSSRDVSWDEVGHQTWVEDADAIREHLGHEKVVLFGHSYGGFLAQEYALRFPNRLAGLILCSTCPVMNYPDLVMANAQARSTAEMLAGVGEVFSGAIPDDEAFERVTQTILPLYFHRFDPERAAGMFGWDSYSVAAFRRAFGQCLLSFDTTTRLGEVRVPTLLLSGADDWIMPLPETLGRLQAGIAHAEARVFERSGHFPFVEEPERFLSEVRGWLGREGLVGQCDKEEPMSDYHDPDPERAKRGPT